MLAALVGAEAEAARDVAGAAAVVDPVADAPPTRLRAFVPIWKRPWMTMSGGTYGSSLLAAVGVANVFADASVRYPTVTLDEVRARRPDVVLAPSEPYPFAERHVPAVRRRGPGRAGRRPGPVLVGRAHRRRPRPAARPRWPPLGPPG